MFTFRQDQLAGGTLLNAGSIETLRASGLLPEDAQTMFDKAVTRVGRQRLVLIDDMISDGLSEPIEDWLSVLEMQWEKMSHTGKAQRSMSPDPKTMRNDLPQRGSDRLPIYATTEYFRLDIRTIRAALKSGAPLQTDLIEMKTRFVNEAIEDAAWHGVGASVASHPIYGILTSPNVNSFSFVGNEAWSASGHTGEECLADVQAGITVLKTKKKYGPYRVYYPPKYEEKMGSDYKANSDKTIKARIEELDGVKEMKVADKLEDQTSFGGSDYSESIVIIDMNKDTLDLPLGQDPAHVSWSNGGPWTIENGIIACVCPRIKEDYDGNNGIVVGSPNG